MTAMAREPRSVVHDGDLAVAGIQAIHEVFEAVAPGDESAAWARLQPRRHRRRRVWPLFLLLSSATAGAGAIAAAVVFRAGDGGGVPAPASIATAPVASPVASPVVEQLPAPQALAAGSSLLPGRQRVHVRDGTRAAWFAMSPSAGHLVLESGTLEVDAPAPVEVRVGSLRVDGSAGRFKVATRPGRIDLAVDKGEVAVWSSTRRLAVVVAGEHWRWPPPGTTDDREPPARAAASGATRRARGVASPAAPLREPTTDVSPAPESEARDCLRLARDGVTDAAIVCFERQAVQTGLAGEIALLELARINRDVKGDLAAAERLLAEHRRRFPHGALAAEARTFRLELLQHGDAERRGEATRKRGKLAP